MDVSDYENDPRKCVAAAHRDVSTTFRISCNTLANSEISGLQATACTDAKAGDLRPRSPSPPQSEEASSHPGGGGGQEHYPAQVRLLECHCSGPSPLDFYFFQVLYLENFHAAMLFYTSLQATSSIGCARRHPSLRSASTCTDKGRLPGHKGHCKPCRHPYDVT